MASLLDHAKSGLSNQILGRFTHIFLEAMDRFASALMKFSAGLLAMMCALILYQVVMRELIGTAPIWINDLTTYTAVWIVFILMGVLIWNDNHLSINVFYQKLPVGVQKYARVLQLLIIIWVSVEFAYLGFEYSMNSGFQSQSPTLDINMFWLYISTTVGGLMNGLFTFAKLLQLIVVGRPEMNDTKGTASEEGNVGGSE